MIYIKEKDNFYYKLEADDNHKFVLNDIVDFFAIFDPSVIHTYEFKNKLTDGKTRFVNPVNHDFLRGLKSRVIKWLELNEYEYEDNTEPIYAEILDEGKAERFMMGMGLEYKPYDFQSQMLADALNHKRIILWSAVGSGKSLTIYSLTRIFTKYEKKVLILTPDLMLKTQLHGDFFDYYNTTLAKLEDALEGEDRIEERDLLTSRIDAILLRREQDNCEDFDKTWKLIENKKDQATDASVHIINFQSLIGTLETNPGYFSQFDAIIVDEVHKAGSASTYYQILEAMNNSRYRIGFTGTKPSDMIDLHTLDGLFGATKKIVTLQELVKRGIATPFEIQPIILQHNHDDVDKVWNVLGLKTGSRKMTWAEEAKFVRLHKQSRVVIARFAIKLARSGTKGAPTIILIKNRDAQKLMVEILQELGYENYHLINGDVKAKDREVIRQLASRGGDMILVGGERILSTGINIPALTHIIKLQGKAEIELIQALGRATRKHEDKVKAVLWDIIDDIRYISQRGSSKDNYHVKHWKARRKVYKEYDITPEKAKTLVLPSDTL